MSKQLNREEAWALLTEYNQDPFHLHHARTVEGVMRYFAQELGYGDEVDFWGIVGLLHDLDFERYPDQHCIQSQEIMRERDLDERLIHATASHGYGITVDIQPEHEMEKVLFATDELTGLIGAAALMRPSKSVQDMELKSLKKKYKSSGFAAGCSREVIQRGAATLISDAQTASTNGIIDGAGSVLCSYGRRSGTPGLVVELAYSKISTDLLPCQIEGDLGTLTLDAMSVVEPLVAEQEAKEAK